MTGTYEHIIRLNVQNSIRGSSFKSQFAGLNSFLSSEIDRLERRVKFSGVKIVNELALESQRVQRDTITQLGAVRTGRLRDSIRVTGSGLEAHVGTSLYYAQNVYEGECSIDVKGGGSIVVKYRAGPRPWTEISASEFERSIDGIVKGGLSDII